MTFEQWWAEQTFNPRFGSDLDAIKGIARAAFAAGRAAEREAYAVRANGDRA